MISFHFNTVKKPKFFKSILLKSWMKAIAEKEKFSIKELNYIFMTDEELLKINIEYLNHDTYTDIITFDNSEIKGKIESDIFISVERVEANAQKFNTTFENELLRVMAHGLLHLCGYKDKKKTDIEMMRKKEEESLALWLNNK
ncbi:MAG: rRNA maturation RNase YbeY [Chitinophagales bacterium]